MTNPSPIKITDLQSITEITNNDVFLAVDKSDISQSLAGTTKNTTAQVLKNYVFSGFSIGSINAHNDVTISGLNDEQLLRYSSSSGQWVNWTPDYLKTSEVNLDNVVRDTDFTSTGLLKRGTQSGSYSVIADNSTNWNAAHGWGNHANAGYLTSTSLGNISINALSDVDTLSNTPQNGQVLTWATNKWVPLNVTASSGGIALSDLSIISAGASGGGGLNYNNATGVFTYTPADLGSYLTLNALSSISINSLSDVSTVGSDNPAVGEVLSWTGTTWAPTSITTGGVTEGDKGDITVSNSGNTWTIDNNVITYSKIQTLPSSNLILGRYTAGTGNVQEITLGSGLTLSSQGVLSVTSATGLQSRTTASGTLSNLVNNNTAAQGELQIAVAKTYALLKIQTSHAAWVTLYVSDAARDADATRTENTDPLPGSGVIAEVITTGAQTQIITPGTIGWNNDVSVGSTVYLKVINKSGSQANLTVTLTYVTLEV